MSRRADRSQRIRNELATRLRGRRSEIEIAIFIDIRALSDSPHSEDGEYTEGLRSAVAAGVEFGLKGIEHGPEWSGPVPPAAGAQARRAARSAVSLDTVLRRYAAADRLLSEFIIGEVGHFPIKILRHITRTQGEQIDRLMATVASEYVQEAERLRQSPSRRQAERVERLLAGQAIADAGDGLNYEFDAWHLGTIVAGARGEEAAQALARSLDHQALIVPQDEEILWAWFGGRRRISFTTVKGLVPTCVPDGVSLAVGEPRRGADGWRLTHREAQAARQIQVHRPQRLVRATDAVLLAAVLRDEGLAKALLETYLAPLEPNGRSGARFRETLHAYLVSGHNAATAAVALGVSRATVERRLRKVEDLLGVPLSACHAELKVALDLYALPTHAATETPK